MAKKPWKQQVATAELAVTRIQEAFEQSQQRLVLAAPDLESASPDEIENHRRRIKQLQQLGLLQFSDRPATMRAELIIVPADKPDWLDIVQPPAANTPPVSNLATLAQMLPPDPAGPPLPPIFVRHSELFHVMAWDDLDQDPSAVYRIGRLSYYGNPTSQAALAKAAEAVRDVRAAVPRSRRWDAGCGELVVPDADLDRLSSLDRAAIWLFDTSWADRGAFEDPLSLFGRVIFFEGQSESLPFKERGLSDDSVASVLREARHMQLMQASMFGPTQIRPPLVPGGGWRLMCSIPFDLMSAMKCLLWRWRIGPPVPEDLITHTEAGAIVGVKAKTIRDWIKKGRISVYGRSNRPSRAEVTEKRESLRLRAPKTPKKGHARGASRAGKRRKSPKQK